MVGILALCLGLFATAGSAAAACLVGGPNGCFPFPNLDFRMAARVSPQSLPTGKPTSVAFHIGGRVRYTDGTQPSALREAVLTVDKDVEVDTHGLPACGYRKIASRDTQGARRVCRKAIVGSGEATAELTYPENTPIRVTSPLTVFNGAVRDGSRMLFVHGFLPIPVPRAIIARIELKRWRDKDGRRGWKAVARIPRIGDGHGSLLDFSLKLQRQFLYRGGRKSLLSARCPDGGFRLSMPKLLFRNELRAQGVAPRTVLKGGLAVPCKPRG